MYTVVLFNKVLPEHVDEFVENMRICAEKTNQEAGCIRYEALQDVDDPTWICLFQIFTDEAAYQFHQDTEHHRVWAKALRPLARYQCPHPARDALRNAGARQVRRLADHQNEPRSFAAARPRHRRTVRR